MRRAPIALAATVVLAGAALVLALRDDRVPAANGMPVSQVAYAGPGADSLAADLIERIRGLDPVVCELAIGAVRSGNWSRGGPHEPAASEDPRVMSLVRWAMDGGGPEAVPVLGAALADPDPCVRRLAAIRLGRIEDRAATARLRQALDSAQAGEREVAAMGIGIAEDRASIPALIEILEGDESPRARRAAAWALGEIE